MAQVSIETYLRRVGANTPAGLDPSLVVQDLFRIGVKINVVEVVVELGAAGFHDAGDGLWILTTVAIAGIDRELRDTLADLHAAATDQRQPELDAALLKARDLLKATPRG